MAPPSVRWKNGGFLHNSNKVPTDLLDVSKWSWSVLELVLSAAFSNARPKKLREKESTEKIIEVVRVILPFK